MTANERVRVLEMADGDADEVLDALASDTGRATLRALFEEPATPSELAARVDTSVQNIHYHLTNLRDAGLAEPIDTRYSEKGNEMTVYGAASDPLVLVGDADLVPDVRRSLAGVVGGLGLLAAASLIVQWGAERLFRGGAGPAGAVGPAGWGASDPAQISAPVWFVFEVLEPGVLFFACCLVVAAVVALSVDR